MAEADVIVFFPSFHGAVVNGKVAKVVTVVVVVCKHRVVAFSVSGWDAVKSTYKRIDTRRESTDCISDRLGSCASMRVNYFSGNFR